MQGGVYFHFQEEFSQAEKKFLEIAQGDTASPVGFFYLALNYQAWMLDLESDFKEEPYRAALERVITLCQARLKKSKNDARALLYLGNAYGSRAVYQARQGNWYDAFRQGLKAKDFWEKAIEADSALWEAYGGLGSYLYWKSDAVKNLRWLPFVGDNRKKGIEMIALAADSSGFYRDFALSNLMWIYIKERDYTKALSLADDFENKYPQAKFPLWAKLYIFSEQEQWENTLKVAESLLTRLLESQPFNYYNLIEVEYQRLDCLHQLGRTREAYQLCLKILRYPIDDRTKDRQREKLNKVKDLSTKLKPKP
ncbi:MAG: hypothetical protein L0Y74_02260 [candidate division Zixibacteria bacterium]|nr:hypothetical protein [candidate division Zixibacteria bacterium]